MIKRQAEEWATEGECLLKAEAHLPLFPTVTRSALSSANMWTVANCYVFFTVIYIICQIFECCLLCPWPAGCNDTAWKITWSRINRQKTRQTLQIDNRYYRSGQMTNISLQKCDFHNPFMPRGSFVGNVVRYHTHTQHVSELHQNTAWSSSSIGMTWRRSRWHVMTDDGMSRASDEVSFRWHLLILQPVSMLPQWHILP